jgi:hypothetical protein
MDVPKNLPDCVCFLCIEQGGRYVPKGTAFFVSIPADFGGTEGAYSNSDRHSRQQRGNFMPFVDLPLPPA